MRDPYRGAQARLGGPREAEYLAFSEMTRALLDAEANTDDFKVLSAALHANRMLWGALADDCARDDNALPETTRAQIIGLARWVSHHSSRAMRGEEGVAPLIEVNRMMMAGLAGETPAAEIAGG